MLGRPNVSLLCCEDCGFPLSRAMADVESYITQLESTVHRLEAKLASFTEQPGRLIANIVPSCRTTPNVRELTPCVQIVTTRIDDLGVPSPVHADNVTEDSDEEGAPQMHSNRRRTTIFAAVPSSEAGSRKSFVSHSFDQFQPFLSGEFTRESPSNKKKREAGSITFAVPNLPEPNVADRSLQDLHAVEPALSPSPPTAAAQSFGVGPTVPLLSEWCQPPAEPAAECGGEFVVVSEKEVEDKGTQCVMVMKAHSSSQTAVAPLTPDTTPSLQVMPTPPRSVSDVSTHFLRHTVSTDAPPSRSMGSDPRGTEVPHLSLRVPPTLYEARRGNRISSISSQRNNSFA